jgi:short-subunit dehydrogenase
LGKTTVLITGGGYGIGASIARSFAEACIAQMFLAGRTESKLKETAESLKSFNDTEISYYVVDISSKADVARLFETLPTSPDILINNAGFMIAPANFVNIDLEEYWIVFSINIYGTALVTQSYLRQRRELRTDSTPTAVVVTLNTLGAYGVCVPTHSSYMASKAALARWMEGISLDISGSESHFISVHPGTIKTAMAVKSRLDGAFPYTDANLAGDFIVWTTSEEAKFLSGRFVWVNWYVDELVAMKAEIVNKDLLRTSLLEN